MKNHSKKLPKWTIVRRIVQFAVLLLFLTPFLAEIEGENFFFGTLSSSEILGIMLTDPFGALQIIFASKTVHTVLLIGAVTIFAFYFLIRGRVFCGWVCPVNLILEFCNRLRKLFKIKKTIRCQSQSLYQNMDCVNYSCFIICFKSSSL